MKNTVLTLQQQKRNGDKITMLTAYDYTTAKLMDKAGINCLLVGDSLGMVMLGYDSTLPVTMEDMIHHTKAVARGAENAFVVADLPFMAYQVSVEEAVRNAGRLVKEAGAQAVKLEGGKEVCAQIEAINQASIPVIGHLGLTPQSVNVLGGYKVQGREHDAAVKLLEDALAVEKAGAVALVLECVPATFAEWISSILTIPTIGIGAGAGCDGQVLVYQDMLAMFSDLSPKFVKKYGAVGNLMKESFERYAQEVKDGIFPGEEHIYNMDEEVLNELKKQFEEEQNEYR
ncbi:3-methyl-2-oxobutanoate hydroxymethyltransferase [Ornithinibacillus sp. BX22]|uniref:3-methyl-2-oxobutanoate hydroxymethyltransferase n=2 Tax=Ornithinibacillus TaxID=484508 RepID=A0A923L6Y1_9BACI|nr:MULTISPECIES: 3-methyl-2-oxobutanoate hydroxymethyltransferase [Ornithinibacillus]MBC5637554.1 3-methyl-2-oxobutanoate hydroxymethyltransferase [Ornithinibacillus hominis]MBS3679422.1 3-methyl-2-oxobutanoate hydroxymethyltransferase [Ornithinibacillus massiliensis]